MTVEDSAINISSRCLGFKTLSAARSITRRYDDAMRPFGLTGAQFTLLNAVAVAKGASVSKLAEGLSMERTTLSRNLKLLGQRGLVARSEGRSRYELTSEGRKALTSAFPAWSSVQDSIEASLEINLETVDQVLKGLRTA